MDYNETVEKALDSVVITAAEELVRTHTTNSFNATPAARHRLVRAVYELHQFRKHRVLHTDKQETEDQKLDVSQGQYME